MHDNSPWDIPERSQANELLGDAEILMFKGNLEEAKAAYRKAAELDFVALTKVLDIDAEMAGILAVSSASAFLKSEEPSRARGVIGFYDSLGISNTWAENRLEEVLVLAETCEIKAIVGDAQSIDAKQLRLRGGQVGTGVARIESATKSLSKVREIFVNLARAMLGSGYKRPGPRPAAIAERLQIFTGSIKAASYGVRIYLVGMEDGNEPLLEAVDSTNLAREVSRTFSSVVSALANEPTSIRELKSLQENGINEDVSIEALVSDFIDLVPKSGEADEIYFYDFDEGGQLETAALSEPLIQSWRDAGLTSAESIEAVEVLSDESDEIPDTVVGLMHGILHHLGRGQSYLAIKLDDESKEKLFIPEDIYSEEFAALMDKKVLVRIDVPASTSGKLWVKSMPTEIFPNGPSLF